MEYVASEDQTLDMFIKSLSIGDFMKCSNKLNMINIYALEGEC